MLKAMKRKNSMNRFLPGSWTGQHHMVSLIMSFTIKMNSFCVLVALTWSLAFFPLHYKHNLQNYTVLLCKKCKLVGTYKRDVLLWCSVCTGAACHSLFVYHQLEQAPETVGIFVFLVFLKILQIPNALHRFTLQFFTSFIHSLLKKQYIPVTVIKMNIWKEQN